MRNWFHRFAGRSMYANVMSTVAVFGMLGGTAYAANTLIISNSRQVGTGTIVSRNLKDGQGVQLRDLTKATRTALKGQKGATGPAGSLPLTVFWSPAQSVTASRIPVKTRMQAFVS